MTDNGKLDSKAKVADLNQGGIISDELQKYHELFEKLSVGFYRSTREGKLLSANRIFLKMIGYAEADKLNEISLSSTYYDPDGRDSFIREIEQKGEVRTRNAIIRKRDGSKLEVDEFAIAHYDNGNKILWYEGFVVEVTEIAKTRKRIAFLDNFRILATRLSLSFFVTDDIELDAKIISALEELGRLIQADRSCVFLFSDNTQYFSNTHEWCNDGIESRINTLQHVSAEQYSCYIGQLKQNLPVHVPDVSILEKEAQPEKEILQAQSIQSLMFIPMCSRANIIGFLGFEAIRNKIDIDSETIDILMIVAGLIAAAVQRRMSFQELAKHRHHLELMVSERTANLERAEAKYRLIATNSHDVIWTMDKTMKTTYMSPSVEKHLGYTPEEYLKLSIEERLPAESNLKVKQIVSDTLAKLQKGEFRKDEAVVFEMLHRCKNGTEMWGEVSFILLFDETGAISGFHGVTRNIHQRKLAEHALHESRKQFMALVENTSDWIWEVDPTDRFTYSNPMVEKIIGYKPEEVIGQVYSDFLDPAEKERVVSTFLNFRDARVPFQKVSFTIIHRNGKKVKLESSGVPVQNYDGVFTGYRGIVRDVTESTLEDESLRQMQNKHRHHLRNTQLGYIEWDINKEVIEWNQSAERIFGYLKMQAISEKIFYKIIPPELHDDIDKIWSQIVEGCKPVAMINDNLNREGEVIVCSWHNTPLLNDQGELVAVASLVEDITDTERVKQGNPHIIQTFEHWENGVILFKSRLKILAANAVARNLLGISVSETNNHNLSSFFDKEELMKLKKNLLPLVVRNNVWNGSLLIKTNKGVQLVQSAIQRHFNPESQSLIFIMMFPASK